MYLNWKLSKVFYGWWVVSACFLISLYLGGVVILGFTAFFEPIANEFGWSYAQISLAASLRGMEVGLLAPVLGLLVDRWGPRRLIFGGDYSPWSWFNVPESYRLSQHVLWRLRSSGYRR